MGQAVEEVAQSHVNVGAPVTNSDCLKQELRLLCTFCPWRKVWLATIDRAPLLEKFVIDFIIRSSVPQDCLVSLFNYRDLGRPMTTFSVNCFFTPTGRKSVLSFPVCPLELCKLTMEYKIDQVDAFFFDCETHGL